MNFFKQTKRSLFRVVWAMLICLVWGETMKEVQAVTLNIGDASVQAGGTVDVPVDVEGFVDLIGMQGTFLWDNTALQFVDVVEINLAGLFFGDPGDGNALALSWEDETLAGVTLDDSTVIFKIRFNAIGNGGTDTEVNLGDSPTMREAVESSFATIEFFTTPGTISILAGEPPTITAINPVTLDEDTSGQVLFTVGDVEDDAGNLVVEAVSSNPSLFPNANLVVGGTGADRTLHLTPAPNAFGSATVSVTVTDSAGNSVPTSFEVTVNPVDDPPSIVGLNEAATINEDNSFKVYFTVQDIDSPLDDLSVVGLSNNPTLVPNENITISDLAGAGSGLNGRYWKRSPGSVLSIAEDGLPIINGETADGTFTGTVINYIGNDLTPIVEWLDSRGSGDGTSFSGNASNLDDGLISLTGFLAISEPGTVNFSIPSDDGTVLWISGQKVVDNDGSHGAPGPAPDGSFDFPEAGLYPIELAYFNSDWSDTQGNHGGASIQLISDGGAGLGNPGGPIPTAKLYGSDMDNPNFTMEIEPVADGFGSTLITIQIRDSNANILSSASLDLTVNPVNDLPTIGSLSNQFTEENTPLGPLDVLIGDVETEGNELLLEATSSDTSLLPLNNIVLGGSGNNRTVTLTPATDTDGTSQVTLTVKDGEDGQASTTFSFIVSNLNKPPVISEIPDQDLNEDNDLNVSFTISDSDTAADLLDVQVTSDNDELLPQGALLLSGSGGNRVLKIMPPHNAYGTATITIEVTDDGLADDPEVPQLSKQQVFQVTVHSVNDLPILFGLTDGIQFDEDGSGELTFYAGDIEAPLDQLEINGESGDAALLSGQGIVNEGHTPVNVFAVELNGASERPNPVVSNGQGEGALALHGDGSLFVEIHYQGLGSNITAAHIHGPAGIEEAAGVLVNLQPVHDGAFDNVSGRFVGVIPNVDANTQDLLLGGQTYVNIHTVGHGGGEIRGQVLPFQGQAGLFTLSVTPEADAFGTTSLTVEIFDGEDSVEGQSQLTVNPINDSPELTLQTEVEMDEDSQINVPFSSHDPETAPQNLIYSVTSSNSNLLPVNRVSLTGTGSDMNLNLVPLPNTFGTGQLTLTVEDEGGLTASSTLNVTVNPVNDLPTISSVDAQVTNEDTTLGPLSITINDVETSPDSLEISGFSDNGALVPEENINFGGSGSNRTLTILPAADQFGFANITLTVTDADGGTASTTFALTVNDVLDSNGSGQDGYVAGAMVFFDGNKNRTADAGEPSTTTDSAGKFTLPVVVVNFDDNANGTLEPSEGQLVMQGGIDIATGLPLKGKLTAPPNSTVINPLTTLINTLLNQNPNLTVAEAEARVESSLNLSVDVDLTTYDPFDAAAKDDPKAGPVLNASSKVQDTVVQVAALLSGNTGKSSEETTEAVNNIIADKILNNQSVNLSEDTTVEEIIVSSAVETGANVSADAADGVSEIVAATNNQKDIVTQTAGASSNVATEISRVQAVAQGDVADDLTAVGGGSESLDNAVVRNTGDNLNESINNATVGDVLATQQPGDNGTFSLKFTDPKVSESGENIKSLTVVRSNGNQGAVTVEVTLSANTAVSPADFQAGTINVAFADQEISKTVDLSGVIVDNALDEGNKLVNVNLALAGNAPAGAVLGAQNSGVLTIVDNDSYGSFAFQSNSFSVRENGERINAVTIVRTGGTAGPVNVVVTPSEAAGGATAGVDFPTNPITVTFNAGNVSKRVTIPVIDDTTVEGDEILNLALSMAQNAPGGTLGGTTTATLTIVNNDFNTAPTISNIENRTISEDGALSNVGFTVGDAEDDVNGLTLSGQSSNQALVPSGNITFGGSGAARTVSVVPANNATGTVTLTLTVSDGQADSSTQFDLTVDPVNDAPTITNIEGGVIDEDGGVLSLPFTISDIDNDVNRLVVNVENDNPSLFPNNQMQFVGEGENRSLNLVPAPNAFGVANMTVSVTDLNAISETSFRVTVNNINDPPSLAAINDQTSPEDTVITVPILFADSDNSGEELQFDVQVVDNQELFPADRVSFSLSQGQGVLTLNPTVNESGQATVSVTVSDGEFSASQSFNITVTPVDDPPSISAVENVTMNENESVTVVFTVSDPDTTAEELEVMAEVSNSELFDAESLVVEGSGSERHLVLRPRLGKSGSATIVLTVTDGTQTDETSFIAVVQDVADPPEISVIDDTSVDEDTTATFSFSITDKDTPLDEVQVQALTLNPEIVPESGLVLTGGPADYTLTVTPAVNAFGVATLRIEATDGEQSVRRTFVLTVNDVKDLPVFSGIEDLTTQAGNPVTFNFTVTDEDTPAGEVTVTALSFEESIVPSGNITIEGEGEGRTLTVVPVDGASGEAPIRLEAVDTDGNRVRITFVLTVESNEPAVVGITFENGTIAISWSGEGELQAAETIAGPYTAVEGAVSPFNVAPTGNMRFFRVVR